MKIRLASLIDTKKLAVEIAKVAKFGDVIALSGNLGAGKTAFAKLFIKELCGDEVEVPSPTFTLVQTYDAKKASLGEVAHFDFYRLKDAGEVVEIGFEDALLSGVCLIEWAEKIGAYMPRDYLRIHLQSVEGDEGARDVNLEACGSGWQDRLAGLEHFEGREL
jgi:tRNA threonylcarbamoyl adenosine modification protein YjeE